MLHISALLCIGSLHCHCRWKRFPCALSLIHIYKTPLADESVDDEYEDTITIPVPLEAFGDAGLLGKELHIQVIDGAVVITEDTDDD